VRRIAALIGRILVGAALSAFLVALALFAIGTYLMSWPFARFSERQRKLRALMDVAAALAVVWQLHAQTLGDRPESPSSSGGDAQGSSPLSPESSPSPSSSSKSRAH
jgi:type II secretory pathway pseudopilin PulG